MKISLISLFNDRYISIEFVCQGLAKNNTRKSTGWVLIKEKIAFIDFSDNAEELKLPTRYALHTGMTLQQKYFAIFSAKKIIKFSAVTCNLMSQRKRENLTLKCSLLYYM